MDSHDFWNVLTAYVLAPLVVLSAVLGWPGLVQLTLTLLMVSAAFLPTVRRSHIRRR